MTQITVYDETAKMLEAIADKNDTTVAEILDELITAEELEEKF